MAYATGTAQFRAADTDHRGRRRLSEPDRFRTTDVRASALNAWRQQTHLEVLGGRCCPDITKD
jgi:hypothetical protein